MLIIELTYKKSLDKVNEFLQAHRDFLDKYYEKGIFLASGAKVPRDGGVILAIGAKEDLLKIIKEDPFHEHAIAAYRVIEFQPSKYSKDFSLDWR